MNDLTHKEKIKIQFWTDAYIIGEALSPTEALIKIRLRFVYLGIDKALHVARERIKALRLLGALPLEE